MAKYLILLAGLLVGAANAANPYGRSTAEEAALPYEDRQAIAQDRLQESEMAEQQRQDEGKRWEPVIVNGPGGAKMYYPSYDGKFYQTYDR
jgi:hypothetical protein